MKINKNNYPLLKDYANSKYTVELMATHQHLLQYSDFLKEDYIKHISDKEKSNPEYVAQTIFKTLQDKSLWKFIRRCYYDIKSQKGLLLIVNGCACYYDFQVSEDRTHFNFTIIVTLGNTVLSYVKGVNALDTYTMSDGNIIEKGRGYYYDTCYVVEDNVVYDFKSIQDGTFSHQEVAKKYRDIKDSIYTLLLFKQFCPIKTKTLVPRVNTKIKMLGEYIKSDVSNNIDVLDATWYTTLITSLPFEVRPYIRWQKKNGVYQHVLVNGHKKSITRKAKKLKNGLDE
jgi:hypothetical protein